MQFTFRFEGHPPSLNQAFATNFRTRRRFKSKAYDVWCRHVFATLVRENVARPESMGVISVEIEIHSERWQTKKGTVRKVDLANFEKTLIDPVFDFLGLDDSMIFELRMFKRVADSEYTILKIFDASEH